jgi:predicted ATPase
VYVVPPLPVPAEGARLQPGDLIPYDALAHFVGRATALHAEGRAEVQDAEAVATPCRRLDGLPLAIELVAGRTATLPVKILAQRSDDQLPVLSLTGSRSAPTRHHMLRAALEYSYALCSERARLLWSRLSVFAGGATLESVLDVCADGALPRHEFESALTELAHKSIVSFEAHRYRMSVSIRAFGRERLLELGEEPCLRSAHRDHFASMAGDPHAVLSPRTVEGHVQNILVKLGSTSRTQIAAAVAQQAGAADGAGLSRVRRTWVIADDRRALNPQRAGADPTRSVNTCNLSHQELA